MLSDIGEIDARIQMAEYAAIHIANNVGVWLRYYDGGVEQSQLVNDFKQLVRENKSLRQKLFDMECSLEAAGVKIP